jgi:multifunctional beta-oxidation protein
VVPGETIVTSLWREGKRILIAAKTKERGTPVISNAAITLR